MPVVFQPSDSGFNSHLRGGSGGWSGGGEEGAEGSPFAAMPVPFVRVLYEREVATLSMPHLKSFDLELQARKMLHGVHGWPLRSGPRDQHFTLTVPPSYPSALPQPQTQGLEPGNGS